MLRDRLKTYFEVRLAWPISDDEADLYLDSLAEFYALLEDRTGRPPTCTGGV